MLSVTAAKRIIRNTALKNIRTATLKTEACLHMVLAENIYALFSSPPFPQSSMDGYAVRKIDVVKKETIILKGEIPAGKNSTMKLKRGTAARVFTGSAVPAGADMVIPQEFIHAGPHGNLDLQPSVAFLNNHIRPKGSQFKKGELLVGKHTFITSAVLAIIASAGRGKVKVFIKPRISLIITGNELVKAGNKLLPGKVIESNSIMVSSMLAEAGFDKIQLRFCKDDERDITAALRRANVVSDVILVCGGISVGKYDYVKTALAKLNTKTLFYKVKQRPGKPLYFGKMKKTFVFGLPGNPASAFVCMHEYALPFIKTLSAFKQSFPKEEKARLLNAYRRPDNLGVFLKGHVRKAHVKILEEQESYKIRSLIKANCLVYFPQSTISGAPGDEVCCHILPAYD